VKSSCQFCKSTSPVSVLHGTNLYSTNVLLCFVTSLSLHWVPYIDAPRTCITENTPHDRYPLLLCDVSARALYCNGSGTDLWQTRHVTATHSYVTSPRTRKLCAGCVATAYARTQRKPLHRIFTWSVRWKAPTGPLPNNALRKSITVYTVMDLLKGTFFASRNSRPSSCKSHFHLLRLTSLHDFRVLENIYPKIYQLGSQETTDLWRNFNLCVSLRLR
jgi:hypothetical protein